jgi:hypothetical protein
MGNPSTDYARDLIDSNHFESQESLDMALRFINSLKIEEA